MANHKSAEKRHRQSLKRRDRNRIARSSVRTSVIRVKNAVEAGDLALAKKLLLEAEKMLSSAASKKLVHRKNASRRIGRLASAVSKAQKK